MFLFTTNAPSRLRTVRLNTSEINLPFFVSSSVRQSAAFFISFLPTLSASGKSHQIPSRAGEPLGRQWDREDLYMNGLQGSDFHNFSFCLWNMNDDDKIKTWCWLSHNRNCAAFVYPLETLLCPHIGLFWLDETAAELFSNLFAGAPLSSLLTPMIPEWGKKAELFGNK